MAILLLVSGVSLAQVKVYKKSSTYSGDVRFTFRDGKLYEGNSTYSGDVLATIRDNRVYEGNSSYSGDILFTMSDFVAIEEFVAIWHCVKYAY